MTHFSPRVEECCGWCKRPVDRCRGDVACDDSQTYSGVLLRGEWACVDEQQESGREPAFAGP
jgi:hypothetical protein